MAGYAVKIMCGCLIFPVQSSSGHDAVVDEFSISSLSRLDQKQQQRTEFCRPPRGENCFRDSGFDILSESKPFLSSSSLPFAGGTVGPKWPSVTDGDYQSCNTKYGDIKSRLDGQSCTYLERSYYKCVCRSWTKVDSVV